MSRTSEPAGETLAFVGPLQHRQAPICGTNDPAKRDAASIRLYASAYQRGSR